jgi:endonuclease/exonuclease/phosphatase family metal-dependent hydrolase
MKRVIAIALAAGLTPTVVAARDLRVATWNLGWHLSQAEAQVWIDRCGTPFAFNEAASRWEPAASGTPGWQLRWARDAPILWDLSLLPPCDVFQANFRIVPATPEAYRRRSGQIGTVLGQRVDPDVIAFQEVSGEQAVREILPDGGTGYHVCSFQDFKVQRLAFAWRRELGDASEPCSVNEALSLPDLPPEDRVRPGLSLGLRIGGKLVRFLNVHLKSSCVSPLEAGDDEDGRGALAGGNEACRVLQRQVRPLEAWIEESSSGADGLVLGDLNRNVRHEQSRPDSEPVRTDRSDPATPLPDGVRVRSLLAEVDDDEPEASSLDLLEEVCSVSSNTARLCERAKSARLSADEARQVSAVEGLGCRNPVGLDHILISRKLTALPAEKVALGAFGRTRAASGGRPDPLLAVSDHCPLATTIRF